MRHFLLFLFITVSININAQSSTLSNFFKYEGVKTLANLAHPTNIYETGSFIEYSNSIVVTIHYQDGYYTKLRINKGLGLFTGIELIDDNDWFSPFAAISLLKILADDAMQDSSFDEETKSKLERQLGKMYHEFDGMDIALLLLNLKWSYF